MWIILTLVVVIAAGILIFMHLPKFGRVPRGERKARIEKLANYRDGKFVNEHTTPQLTGDKGMFGMMVNFLFNRPKNTEPQDSIPAVKTDLHVLGRSEEVLVWFGHSSVFFQTGGVRFLVDPVFSTAASPVPFFNKAFPGTDIYRPEDMPDLDYLVISHDHWDHLDYPTVKVLKERTDTVICPVGVGEHFERWGFDMSRVIELEWDQEADLTAGFHVWCLPARHFSGRGLNPNQSLWASFLVQTPNSKIFIGGDSGYDTHFAAIGERFGEIDLALLENGQYGEGWRYIHMLPDQFEQAALDLRARTVIPVHNSKFALANHPWYEPMATISALHNPEAFRLLTPMIGQPVDLKDTTRVFEKWWEGRK